MDAQGLRLITALKLCILATKKMVHLYIVTESNTSSPNYMVWKETKYKI